MAMALPSSPKKVLVPIVAGTEPVEAFVPIDVLRHAGADVTVASAGNGLLVEAMYGVKVVADALVGDCAAASYDLIALPGGVPGAENLGGCVALESIARRHAEKGSLCAAICAAPPLTLACWGLLDGLKATAHPLFVCQFPPEVTAVEGKNVVVDGNAVTSRGPATSMEFALALVERLYGKEKAEQIATLMLVRHESGYSIEEVNPVEWRCNGTPKVLVPVADGTEEMEAIVVVDALRRANADVVVASAEGGVEVVGQHGMRIVADATLDAAADETQFDLIVVPGGTPAAKTLDGGEKLVALLKRQAAAGRPYAAIGAAVARVLEPHGLLKGKKAATHPSMAGVLADGGGLDCECESGSRVVVDGNVMTSRGPGTAMEFAVAAVEKLLGREEARRVADGLLFA